MDKSTARLKRKAEAAQISDGELEETRSNSMQGVNTSEDHHSTWEASNSEQGKASTVLTFSFDLKDDSRSSGRLQVYTVYLVALIMYRVALIIQPFRSLTYPYGLNRTKAQGLPLVHAVTGAYTLQGSPRISVTRSRLC